MPHRATAWWPRSHVRRRIASLGACLSIAAVGLPAGGQATTFAPPDDCLDAADSNRDVATAQELPATAACVRSANADGSQDIFWWTVPDGAVPARWTLSMSPVPGQAVTLEVHRVEVDAAGLTLSDETLASATSGPGAAATLEDELFPPGRYVVGAVASGPGAYELRIEPGAPLPAGGDVEPNDTAEQATVVADAFALLGDRGSTPDVYAWDVGTDAAAGTWRLDLQVPLLDAAELRLSDAAGRELFRGRTGPGGVLGVADVAVAPGRYLIEVSAASSDAAAPYVLTATPGPPPDENTEREPNDAAAQGTPVALVVGPTTVSGRLATASDRGDVDLYRFSVGGDVAGRQLDVKAFWRGGSSRRLCLLDGADQELQCVDGDRAIALNDMVLPTGEYYVAITGEPAPDDRYLLRFDVTAEASTGFEGEPNDTPRQASPLAPDGDGFAGAGRLAGRGLRPDTDTFSFAVAGAPQLWEITATGSGVERLESLDVVGSAELTGSVVGDALVITDAFLLPGDHAIDVTGTGGDYTVTVVPLGPPDPFGEHEPNNGPGRSQAIRLGETRVGRLPATEDVDYYRFSLRNDSHVAVEVDVPDEAQYEMTLARGGESVGSTRNPDDGGPLVYDAVLPPGDYSMTLSALVPSDERYQVRVIPTDPYVVPDDAEPNDSPAYARPIAPDWAASGTIDPGSRYGDVDWYLLPEQERAGPMAIDMTGDGVWLDVRTQATADQPETSLAAAPGESAGEFTVDVPAGVPLLVGLGGAGDYELVVTPVATGDRPARPAPLADVALSWEGCDVAVAAYWIDAQRIECTLRVSNDGPGLLDAALDATAGDFAWSVAFETDSVTISSGDSVTVGAEITVAPDAWADDAVLVTARAVADGGFATASTTVVPDREAVPSNPIAADPLAPELLGGLDVAGNGLGATVVAADDATAAEESLLHDGLAPLNLGWSGDVALLPVELTVDLAGDQPVPVAGFSLDPRASNAGGSDQLRDFDVELSVDGATWEPAISAALLAVPVEQSFVLPAPVPARFARLRLRSAQNPSSSVVVLGEWSVIAEPGWMPPVGTPGTESVGGETGIDIGSPARGGHVVSVSPAYGAAADLQSLLVADASTADGSGVPGEPIAIVIGFEHNRAAQPAFLTWSDPADSDPSTRLGALDVAVSVSGPSGPWLPLGAWTLDRSAGAVEPFELPDGTWARFVRLTGTVPAPIDDGSSTLPPDVAYWEPPDRIGVIERPIDGDYRSVVGAWGIDRQTGLYERAVRPPAIDLDADAGDDAAGATPLAFDRVVNDTAWVGRDEDWYHVTVPAGETAIAFTVGGTTSVDVDVALFDAAGNAVELDARPAADGVATTFTALVEPLGEYDLQVVEPPTSVIFAFDTSMSIGPYVSAVYQGVARYAADVEQGQEAVNVLPFGDSVLLADWTDEPYLIQAAVNDYPQTATSSDAEGALITSMHELAERPGARAVLLVTDAQTTPAPEQLDELWARFASTRPRIYAVHVAGGTQADQDLMEDWAAVNGGVYTYVTDQGSMDVAFDRAATALRRPSQYSLSVAVAEPPPPPPTTSTSTTSTSTTATPTTLAAAPGTLVVGTVPGGAGASVGTDTGSASVALILDTSGSMLQQLPSGGRRIDAARAALTNLVTQTLAPGTNVSLRVFGAAPESCETSLLVPQSPLDPAPMAEVVAGVPVVDGVRTPIAASLQQVGGDLGTAPGPKIVVLVTDGEETCDGDPGAVIAALAASGIDVHVNIVGFALDDAALKAQFEDWARVGNGRYIDAADQGQLTAAMAAAVQPTFDVLDAAGTVVATGQAGGAPVAVPAGDYTVALHTSPEQRLPVSVLPGQETALQP